MEDSERSRSPSRSNTPNPRFTTQASTAEDLLKSQTVGLVQLSEFRRRRAEALDQESKDSLDSGASTPSRPEPSFKPSKRKRDGLQAVKSKKAAKGALSFGNDDEDEDGTTSGTTPTAASTRDATPDTRRSESAPPTDDSDAPIIKRKLVANASVGHVAKSMTKHALLREAQVKEQLRKEFLVMQEAVRATEFLIPFVFYDGADISGGTCRMKKGDMVWLFLDRARKVGAEQGVGGSDKSRREWARVAVDDLMMVKGDMILPHHYEFYYFMLNKSSGYKGALFSHSAEPTAATKPLVSDTPNPGGLSVPTAGSKATKSRSQTPSSPDSELEGCNDDPTLTKVVDRRWYEKNKHIYPASTWEDFDPTKEYKGGVRKDAEGNAFFLR